MLSSLQDISILRQWASDLIYPIKNYPVQLPGAAPCCGYSSSAVIHPAAEPADSAHRLIALFPNLYLGGGFSESQAEASHPGSNHCSCERAWAEKTPQSVTFLPIHLGEEVFAGQWQQSQPCEGAGDEKTGGCGTLLQKSGGQSHALHISKNEKLNMSFSLVWIYAL